MGTGKIIYIKKYMKVKRYNFISLGRGSGAMMKI
jgi:hypothetical protein